MRCTKNTCAAGSPASGFTMIELMIVASVLLLTLLFFSQSMGSTAALSGVNRETGLATEGAREIVERMQGTEDFARVFRLYNDYPDDDPNGPGTAPGAGFAVAGLEPTDDDPDGLVGEIRFPTVPGPAGPQLREDVVDDALGMPRDLDGDGLPPDALDKKDTYRLLPVELTLRWKGKTGVRSIQLQTLLANR
ncbi:MAG TPA: prepilin-type N-terminal cleavage/methylation domain-containing protein [Planctomycetota bacterium]